MVLTPSTMLPLNTPAPDFSLPDAQGKTVSLSDFQGAPALVPQAGAAVQLAPGNGRITQYEFGALVHGRQQDDGYRQEE